MTDGKFEGVKIIEPDVFSDERGYFFEVYQKDRYASHGIGENFVQDNVSYSIRGTLRGLHYQHPGAQAKLVQVVSGEVMDIIVDVRKGSATFGQSASYRLSEKTRRQIWIPEGFAHGFCVLSETAVFLYKCNRFYAAESERGILWSDPDLKITWPVNHPVLSDKDRGLPRLKDVPSQFLPE